MSDSVQPQRQQPTRLPRPWDSPGKNTGVGRHFLLQCMKVKCESEVTRSCPTLSDPMDCSLPGSSIRGIFQARVLEWGAIAFSEKSLGLILIKRSKSLDFPTSRVTISLSLIMHSSQVLLMFHWLKWIAWLALTTPEAIGKVGE